MEEDEKKNLFGTFQAVLQSAVEEKMQIPKWKEKIENADVKVNIGLQMAEDEYFYINFVIENGKLDVKMGEIEDYDVEILAAPADLMFMCNGTYGITHMLTKKNEFGDTKLRVKKGGRNVKKLLFVQNLLTFK